MAESGRKQDFYLKKKKKKSPFLSISCSKFLHTLLCPGHTQIAGQ